MNKFKPYKPSHLSRPKGTTVPPPPPIRTQMIIPLQPSLLRDRAVLELCDCAEGLTVKEISDHLERLERGAPMIAVIGLLGTGYLYIHFYGTAAEPSRYRTSAEGREYICMIADLCSAAEAQSAARTVNVKSEVTA